MVIGQIVTSVLLVLVSAAVLAITWRVVAYMSVAVWELLTYDLRSPDPALRRQARIVLAVTIAMTVTAAVLGGWLGWRHS